MSPVWTEIWVDVIEKCDFEDMVFPYDMDNANEICFFKYRRKDLK